LIFVRDFNDLVFQIAVANFAEAGCDDDQSLDPFPAAFLGYFSDKFAGMVRMAASIESGTSLTVRYALSP